MTSKIFVLASLMAMLASAAAPTHAEDATALITNVRDLTPYYRKEGIDLANYSSILLGSLGVEDARVVPPPWFEGEDRSPKRWQLTPSDLRFLRDSYRAAMELEIDSEGGYPLVDEPGDGVLVLDIEIIYLMPYARKSENVMVRGFGEMLVSVQLRDGMSGELLALYEGKQDVGSEYQQNSRLNAENDLRALFRYWGARVRDVMDAARES